MQKTSCTQRLLYVRDNIAQSTRRGIHTSDELTKYTTHTEHYTYIYTYIFCFKNNVAFHQFISSHSHHRHTHTHTHHNTCNIYPMSYFHLVLCCCCCFFVLHLLSFFGLFCSWRAHTIQAVSYAYPVWVLTILISFYMCVTLSLLVRECVRTFISYHDLSHIYETQQHHDLKWIIEHFSWHSKNKLLLEKCEFEMETHTTPSQTIETERQS